MPTADLKNDVLSYVDKADDRLLKMMKALAESYQHTEEEASSEEIPDWQKKILDERLADLKANPDKGREWGEVKADLLKRDPGTDIYSLSESSGNEVWANEEELWDEYYFRNDQ